VKINLAGEEKIKVGKSAKVMIWGKTALGKYLAAHIWCGREAVKPLAYIDNNPLLQNNNVENIPVISFEQLSQRQDISEITVLLALKNARNIFQVIRQLEGVEALKIGIVKPRVLVMESQIDIDETEEIVWYKEEGRFFKIIPRLEVNLTDACNLKCKGCSHFSSIFKQDSVYPIEAYEKDIRQLNKVGTVIRMRLLGGEPFLLQNLDAYLSVTRAVFQKADIEVVTNGLLIPKADKKIMTAVKENNINVAISPYKPTLKLKEQIVSVLKKYDVSWYFDGEEVPYFVRNLTLQNNHDGEKSSQVCPASGCLFLRSGRVYKCPVEALINDLYDYYGLEQRYEGGTDIYQNADKLYHQIVGYALEPSLMCQYCAETPEKIKWSVASRPSLQDWLYKDGE